MRVQILAVLVVVPGCAVVVAGCGNSGTGSGQRSASTSPPIGRMRVAAATPYPATSEVAATGAVGTDRA